VAIDQTPSTDSKATPAIDNEFPTYRAISPTAVLSLVFGLASVFCFADLWFLLLSATAVFLGWRSLKKIQQLPEVLTGAGLARVGIGIGLLFGLTSVTRLVAENISVRIDAGNFAKSYIEIIKTQPVSVTLWHQQALGYRKEKTPDAMVEEMKKSKGPGGSGDMYQTASQPILAIKERLDGGKGGEITYDQIETKVVDGLTVYANALVKLDLKATKEHPETEQYALFRMVKGDDDWTIKEVLYPYTPKSAVVAVEKKHDDDGHGH
jgi:hypothetical protein